MNFVNLRNTSFINIEDSKQVYRFTDVKFDKAQRTMYGYIEAGHYGTKNDIIHIETGKVSFEKAQDNAEIVRHFFYILLPTGFNEGFAMLHGYRGSGVKTLFFNDFSNYFRETTQLNFQMNPLSYEKAMKEWQEARTKEIRLVGFRAHNDLADHITGLGHDEIELKLKPPRSGMFGTLKDFLTKGSEQAKIVEVLSKQCDEVKTVVELNGAKRTFTVSGDSGSIITTIQAPEDLKTKDGNPTKPAMVKWCKEVVDEFSTSLYQGQGRKAS